MLEIAIALLIGVAIGYGTREMISQRRRAADRKRREAEGLF